MRRKNLKNLQIQDNEGERSSVGADYTINEMEFQERKRWLFFGLPFTFTKYTINDEGIVIDRGLLNKEEDDCYMYKVQDLTLKTSLMERIFGLGTVVCHTGDVTHKTLELQHIKRSKEIKNFILKASEEARMKRKTVNTLHIDADEMDDLDEFN